jgi:anti-anti-sigma factor
MLLNSPEAGASSLFQKKDPAILATGVGRMELTSETMENGTVRAVLHGRLDTTGAIEIEMPMNALARDANALLIDLSEVTFLSSYGVRILLVAAKSVHGRGGKLALLCPAGNVAKVLQSARAGDLIPTFSTPEAALAAVSS